MNVNLGSGAVTIEKLELVSCVGEVLSLKDKFVTMNIYEDMFSNALEGFIVIVDSLNARHKLPIVGREKLRVYYYSANYGDGNDLNYMRKEFDLYKVDEVHRTNDYTETYTLRFCSNERLKNETIHISNGYRGKRFSTIVKDILIDNYDDVTEEIKGLGLEDQPLQDSFKLPLYLRSSVLNPDDVEDEMVIEHETDGSITSRREVFIEKTDRKLDMYSFTYTRPFNVINNIAAQSIRNNPGRVISNDNKSPARFMFFENKRGYQFVSLDTLFEGKKVFGDGVEDTQTAPVFKYGAQAQNKVRGNSIDTIRQIVSTESFDTISNYRSGMYASHLDVYNLDTGEVTENDFDYLDEWNKYETTNSYTVYNNRPLIPVDSGMLDPNDTTKRPSARRILVPVAGDRIYPGPDEFLQTRLASFLALSTNRVVIEVAGNSRHKVGDMVLLDIRNYDNENLDFEQSKYFYGWYLITSIKHQVSQTEYTMTIELAKDVVNAKIGGRDTLI